MKISRIVPAVAVVAMFAVADADAQALQRKPGLWEIQLSGSGEGAHGIADMNERMAKMPPEKRAQMEAYMKQHGMSFGANSMTTRFCLTPEDVKEEKESADAFLNNRKGKENKNCTSKTLARSATEVKFNAVCKEDDGEIRQVDGRIYDLSPEHFAMEMTSRSNRKGEEKVEQKARWLSADCGNVK